ncbi:putative phospholipase carboxylesterase superfamily protein [Rosellinia necatrix]|uniref:Putative phospholipase carboxylesterase superfamily protein n=1 Tax=Rosellinia necatrix TaxID=77044 RepID=A0A1W2TLA6_ROSNE|nr:putative phospholipase carboxylesterase superfamily protein [Rosellinia necatrix]
MPTRIPRPEDFVHLKPSLEISLVFPEVPETTTSILILFHGLGDSQASFATFAKNINLPGVLAISVRGISPLPPALLGLPGHDTGAPTKHFHWGDDLTVSPSTGDLDHDPGFSKAENIILEKLVRGTLVGACGWETNDISLFGFGQGGSLALGLSSRLRNSERIVDVTEGERNAGRAFKGVVSIGGQLPVSMIPTLSARDKARTPVLICHGRNSESLDSDAVELLMKEFVDVREVKWAKADDGMPKNREEMLPIMQFFAERLRAW